MSMVEVRVALATAVGTATGVRKAYTYWPDQVAVSPALIVVPFTGDSQQVFGGGLMKHEILLYVVAARGDNEKAQQVVDALLEPGGANSLQQILKTDGTLGGTCERAWMKGYEQWGNIEINDTTYAGAAFRVEAWESDHT